MIDLHLHSIFSDGTNTPEELIELASAAGLYAAALTDHDTTAGQKRFAAAAQRVSIKTVTGIELSADFGAVPLHILGYDFELQNAELQTALEFICIARAERNEQILSNLNRLGYELTMSDMQKLAGDKMIGRPHFAAALVNAGHFKTIKKVFMQLLGKGRAAYAERQRFPPEQCIELIRNAGGFPVIAHPGQMDISSGALRRLIERLLPHGLAGLEVWHASHKESQSAAFLQLSKKYNLIATGGSDFHGKHTPYIKIGTGYGTLSVPDEIFSLFSHRSKV
ncbi:MAG: PHP domain-containing protein [Kiritimatiellales bacterium]